MAVCSSVNSQILQSLAGGRLKTTVRMRRFYDVDRSCLLSVHPLSCAIGDIDELADLPLHVRDTVGENCELLSLIDEHFSKESPERCAGAGKHTGTRKAIACGMTNMRKMARSELPRKKRTCVRDRGRLSWHQKHLLGTSESTGLSRD